MMLEVSKLRSRQVKAAASVISPGMSASPSTAPQEIGTRRQLDDHFMLSLVSGAFKSPHFSGMCLNIVVFFRRVS